MFNAYFLRRGYHVSDVGNIIAWVDSGGFLFLDAPQRRLAGLHGSKQSSRPLVSWSEDLVELVLRRQEDFGARVAFSLDYPLPPRSHLEPDCCPSTVAERIRLSALGAAIGYQLRRRSSMRLLVVLQYNGVGALRKYLEILEGELRSRAGIGLDEVDGFAIGGLVPHSARWWLLARRLQEARKLLGWDKWIHLLGVASPHNIPLIYYAGADSADSKTYIIAAAKRLYYQPPGSKPARIDLRGTNGARPSCECPACTSIDKLSDLRSDTKKLAIHNLYVTLQAAKKASEKHSESKLRDYLKQLSETNPRIKKAFREIAIPRPQRHQTQLRLSYT